MLKFGGILIFISLAGFILENEGFVFGGSKEKCEISLFKGGKDFSGEPIMANKVFVPQLKTIGNVAKQCKVRVRVTDSYKQLKNPDDFVLMSQMPLAHGRGIHFDLQDPKGSTVCNKLCMVSRSWKTLPEASCFITNVQKKGLKFVEPNLLHDGHTTSLTTTQSEAQKVAIQKLCAPKKGTKG